MGKMKDALCFDTPDFPQEWEDDITFSREYDDDDFVSDSEDYWNQCAEDAMMEAHLFGDC